MPPAGASVPPSRSFEATLCGVRTHFVLTAYANRIFVVVTQTQNLGTLVRAEPHSAEKIVQALMWLTFARVRALRVAQILASADNPLNATGTSYSTRVLIGRRDDEMLEAYARTMVELITKRCPNGRPLLLAISIKEHSDELFRAVMQQVEEHRVW